MTRKGTVVHCCDCEHWEQVDPASGLCELMVKRGIHQPATGEGYSCMEGKLKPTVEAPC
jgi:hypothetical protein